MKFLQVLSTACMCTLLFCSSSNAEDAFNDDEKIYCAEESVEVTSEGIKVCIEETAENEAQVIVTEAIHSDTEGLYVLPEDIISKCPCSSKKTHDSNESK